MTLKKSQWLVIALTLMVIVKPCLSADEIPASGSQAELSPLLARGEDNLYWARSNCCGLISAYMVARDLGVAVTIDELARQLPVSAAGTTMEAIAAYFQQRHLQATGVRMDVGELVRVLRQNPGVRAIVHVRPEHWVPVFGCESDRLILFDYPNWRTMDAEKFTEEYRGSALLIGRGDDVKSAIRGGQMFVGQRIAAVSVILSVLIWSSNWMIYSRNRRGENASQVAIPRF